MVDHFGLGAVVSLAVAVSLRCCDITPSQQFSVLLSACVSITLCIAAKEVMQYHTDKQHYTRERKREEWCVAVRCPPHAAFPCMAAVLCLPGCVPQGAGELPPRRESRDRVAVHELRCARGRRHHRRHGARAAPKLLCGAHDVHGAGAAAANVPSPRHRCVWPCERAPPCCVARVRCVGLQGSHPLRHSLLPAHWSSWH